MSDFSLIFCRDGKIFLTSKKYSGWREIQNEYSEYMASLDFNSLEEVEEHITLDYKLERDFVSAMMLNFKNSGKETAELKF